MLFLIIISSVFLLPEFLNKSKNTALQVPLNNSRALLNLDIVDSDKVKNLEPFTQLEVEFAYVVTDKNGQQITGNISAASKDDARTLLEASGFKASSLKEMNLGNSDPFIPY